MSIFLEGVIIDDLIDEARVLVENSIKAMESQKEPSAIEILDFSTAFVKAMHLTNGPFHAVSLKSQRGLVDPSIIDFLIILATEFKEPGCVRRPVDYYKSLFALDDVSEDSHIKVSHETGVFLDSMSKVNHVSFVSDLFKHRKLSDVITIAKLFFGGQL